MMGNIFSKHLLSDFIESFRKNLSYEIDSLEITDRSNVIKIKEELKQKYTIQPLVLGNPVPSMPKETFREMKGDRGSTYRQKLTEIEVVIPFEGNATLFECQPRVSTIMYLSENVKIYSNSIKAMITLNDFDDNIYKAQVEKILTDISYNIPTVNTDITPWNDGLEILINSLLENRKGVVTKKLDFMEKIGLKVNPKSNEFMIPPPITRKTIPIPVTETTKDVKKEFIPVLQDEVYKDINEVLYNVGKAIERKPSIYLKKHEEDLRDIFLLFLETRYESTSGVGEAFNKKGKTDILLKYAKDGTNIFVAECKFWKGQKKLYEGIDQLLGYLTHRDSKTALILFVDQKEFSSVVTTVKEEIKKHPQFKKHVRDTYEHSINYEFTLPDDSQKIIQIEVMLFHFPHVK